MLTLVEVTKYTAMSTVTDVDAEKQICCLVYCPVIYAEHTAFPYHTARYWQIAIATHCYVYEIQMKG